MQQQKPQPSLLQALDAGLVVQLQALTAQLTAAAAANTLNPLEQRVSSFNKVRELLGIMLASVVTIPTYLYSVPIPVKIHCSRYQFHYQRKTQKHAN